MEKRAAIYCRLSREDDNLACDEEAKAFKISRSCFANMRRKMDSLSIVCMWMKIILDLIIHVLPFAA